MDFSNVADCSFKYNELLAFLLLLLDIIIIIIVISRPVENILGFSRQMVVEVTTNIESQEQRRLIKDVIGYPEHTRAAVTDDLKAFYAKTHRDLGNISF